MSQRTSSKPVIAAVALAAVFTADLAHAQWVMLARHVVGRVESMSQQSPQPGGANYDSAAVMVEVPADKAYAAVVRGVKSSPQGLTVTREDPVDRLVQFTNGQQIAGIKVSPLGDNLSHLMISSAHTGNQPDAAALVLNGVLRACKDMNVACSQARQ